MNLSLSIPLRGEAAKRGLSREIVRARLWTTPGGSPPPGFLLNGVYKNTTEQSWQLKYHMKEERCRFQSRRRTHHCLCWTRLSSRAARGIRIFVARPLKWTLRESNRLPSYHSIIRQPSWRAARRGHFPFWICGPDMWTLSDRIYELWQWNVCERLHVHTCSVCRQPRIRRRRIRRQSAGAPRRPDRWRDLLYLKTIFEIVWPTFITWVNFNQKYQIRLQGRRALNCVTSPKWSGECPGRLQPTPDTALPVRPLYNKH